jgi:hypothetical protein
MAVADFNRDGIADLVVANKGSDTVSVLLGNGGGTFRAAVDYPALPSLRGSTWWMHVSGRMIRTSSMRVRR